MTYTESLKYLNGLPRKYGFTSEENEAFANIMYIVRKRAQEEAKHPQCLYYVGKYYFKDWNNAMQAVKRYKEKYILEKRVDVNGNMITKKYTISNGRILGVHNV